MWSDEFDTDGRLSEDWTYEQGFQRNQELQWYQPDDALFPLRYEVDYVRVYGLE